MILSQRLLTVNICVNWNKSGCRKAGTDKISLIGYWQMYPVCIKLFAGDFFSEKLYGDMGL